MLIKDRRHPPRHRPSRAAAPVCSLALLALGLVPGIALARNGPPAGVPPLQISEQGSFFVGGHDRKSDDLSPPAGGYFSPSGTITVDQMYVQYQKPMAAKKHVPIVLIHGCCLTGKTWETTPDGRIGWSDYFVRRQRATYTVDQVARGRSGFDPSGFNAVAAGKADPSALPVVFSASHEGAWTIFRFGAKYPEVYPNQKFPMAAQAEFWKQMVPDQNPSLSTPNPTVVNLAKLAAQLGRSVLISHSESGPFPFESAVIDAKGISGIISIEPGGCPSYDKKTLRRVAKIPTMVLYGDFLGDFPLWTDSVKSCRGFVQQLKKLGGDARVVVLPDLGIRGNSHMLMQDKNNLKIADLLLKWIDNHVEK